MIRIISVLIATIAAGIAAFVIYFDVVAGAAIEKGSRAALGVDVAVGWVRTALFRGIFWTGSIEVDNPDGYETPYFMQLDSGHFDFVPGSLFEPVIEVQSFELDGLEVFLETAGGTTNYAVILANLRAFNRQISGSQAPTAAEDGKRLIIRQLVVRNISAHIDSGRLSGELDRVGVKIPELRLQNVGSAEAGGASVAEVSDTIVRAVLIAIAREAPAELVRGLLSGAGGLGAVLMEVPGGSTLIPAVGDLGSGVAEQLGDEVGNAVKRLGGLLKRD